MRLHQWRWLRCCSPAGRRCRLRRSWRGCLRCCRRRRSTPGGGWRCCGPVAAGALRRFRRSWNQFSCARATPAAPPSRSPTPPLRGCASRRVRVAGGVGGGARGAPLPRGARGALHGGAAHRRRRAGRRGPARRAAAPRRVHQRARREPRGGEAAVRGDAHRRAVGGGPGGVRPRGTGSAGGGGGACGCGCGCGGAARAADGSGSSGRNSAAGAMRRRGHHAAGAGAGGGQAAAAAEIKHAAVVT